MSSLEERFRANLKRVRKDRQEASDYTEFSQEDLADKAGVARTYISQIERGVKRPSLGTVDQIADALGVDPIELLKEPSG